MSQLAWQPGYLSKRGKRLSLRSKGTMKTRSFPSSSHDELAIYRGGLSSQQGNYSLLGARHIQFEVFFMWYLLDRGWIVGGNAYYLGNANKVLIMLRSWLPYNPLPLISDLRLNAPTQKNIWGEFECSKPRSWCQQWVIEYGTVTFLASNVLYAYEFQCVTICFQASCI